MSWKQKYDFTSVLLSAVTTCLRLAFCESGKPISSKCGDRNRRSCSALSTCSSLFVSCDPCCGLWAAYFPPHISARLPVHHMNIANYSELVFPVCVNITEKPRALLNHIRWNVSSQTQVGSSGWIEVLGFSLVPRSELTWAANMILLNPNQESCTVNLLV